MKKLVLVGLLCSSMALLGACESGKSGEQPSKEAASSQISSAPSASETSSEAKTETPVQATLSTDLVGTYTVPQADATQFVLDVVDSSTASYSHVDAEGQVLSTDEVVFNEEQGTVKLGEKEGTYTLKEDGGLILNLGDETIDFPSESKLHTEDMIK